MSSTFFGLETAKRGLNTHQSALQTTGHNIANANTPGYTRQRVNFKTTEPYPAPALNRPQIPGQFGTGVRAGSVERVRDAFLDVQYRGENSKYGYWNAQAEALRRMEEIMNEPSEDGLAKTLDRFWQSLQDLAVNPNDSGARSVVRQRGIAVADTFRYLSNSLTSIQEDVQSEIEMTVEEINSIARQLDNLNKQIAAVEPHGYLPNDLYDERDRLLDQLSELANLKIDYVKSGGNALDIAEGKVSVFIVASDGIEHLLVNGADLAAGPSPVVVDSDTNEVTIGGDPVELDMTIGKLSGLIDMHKEYTDMLENLDIMAYSFVTRFNEVHRDGWNLEAINSDPPAHNPVNFFEELTEISGAAKNINLDEAIIDSLDNIAAALTPEEGDGGNALKLADVKNEVLQDLPGTSTLQSFYQGIIGEMAVKAQEANRMQGNSDTLRSAVEQRRQSTSGVSLDEEMINMVRFQQAYNASARMVTVVDEMLDKIINGMGIVGR
mgnify:CR=1 FL=1